MLKNYPKNFWQAPLGWSYLVQGDYQEAQEAQDEGQRIAQAHGDYKRLVQLLRDSGQLCSKRGEHSQAEQLCIESLELAKSIGDEFGVLLAKAFRARMAYARGDHREAKPAFLELLPEFQRSHHPRDIDFMLRLLGDIAISEGRFNEAREHLQEASESIFVSYYEAREISDGFTAACPRFS
ncbi:MAG: tetratricopeptide repeat protein [Chloroflexi bacterium]|nr:tetratricopeptide repeat protein [Chloroflexota bacterium]